MPASDRCQTAIAHEIFGVRTTLLRADVLRLAVSNIPNIGKTHLAVAALLNKVHELLAPEGLAVSYSSLYRFARKWCDFGTASSITVRRAESLPREMAEADFAVYCRNYAAAQRESVIL